MKKPATKALMQITSNTDLETLAGELLKDLLAQENFNDNSSKTSFLTGGSVIVCEHKGLQEYLQKNCADKHKIWAALTFKPLAGLLMRCAYNLSSKEYKKDEIENVFNEKNLIWAVYSLLEKEEKTFFFASEIASLFVGYQIYRPEIIEKWNNNEVYTIKNADDNFINNEKKQRELWLKLKKEFNDEQDISELYNFLKNELENKKCDKRKLPKQIFIFAPLSMPPISFKILTLLAENDCKVNLYLHQISTEYIGENLSDKKIAYLRKASWKNWEGSKTVNENEFYFDLGNRLIANLGRSAQVFYEQILDYEMQGKVFFKNINNDILKNSNLLSLIKGNIINDNNEQTIHIKDNSLTINNCFSCLREIEVLCDYILDLFANDNTLTLADIAVVSPNIENYESAIESVFGRNNIEYKFANKKKQDKTLLLLSMLFSLIDSKYEAIDVISLFEYSMQVQGKRLEAIELERLEKFVKENAIRFGLCSCEEKPNYSFESGFEQLANGFFMISENNLSEKGEYCYPDIEGNSALILGDFICFVRALQKIETESKRKMLIEDIDFFLKENLQIFFGTDEIDFNEDKDNPYQKVLKAWDSLKREMLITFSRKKDYIDFYVIKKALLNKFEEGISSFYSFDGSICCANIETIRAVPYKIICCVGMNGKEFPRKKNKKEMSLLDANPQANDKDNANEDRLTFLETILSAKEKLYISFVGQNEKNADELEPSSVVQVLINNLKEQYCLDDIVNKHPLQPFSKKYFNGIFFTYDNRWETEELKLKAKNIWEWEIPFGEDSLDDEQYKNVDFLYKVLSDAPKYFLKDVCGIEFPEETELLENLEPFVVEKGLDEWKLADLILNNKNYENRINVSKFRGDLPNGSFSGRIIEKKIKQINEMIKLEDKNIKTFIKPSKDKGKYRLWHFLKHLEYNIINENSRSEIILLDAQKNPVKIALNGLSKNSAENEIKELYNLANKLKTKMLPIFPDAAWLYINSCDEKKINEANDNIFGNSFSGGIAAYSEYAKIVLGDAKSLEDLGIEKEFKECSEKLFRRYNKLIL